MELIRRAGRFLFEADHNVQGAPSFDREIYDDGYAMLTWTADNYALVVLIRPDGTVGFGGSNYETKEHCWVPGTTDITDH